MASAEIALGVGADSTTIWVTQLSTGEHVAISEGSVLVHLKAKEVVKDQLRAIVAQWDREDEDGLREHLHTNPWDAQDHRAHG